MTPLEELLVAQITENGPISIAEYMQQCLLHPKHGYYQSQQAFGLHGDFTTSPEISQIFGELIGLCLAQAWLDQGAPRRFLLTELGPGRGTLMADILRATKGVKGFHQAAEIHLVEASSALRKLQKVALRDFKITHHSTIASLPHAPLFLIANEFFDALPIRQFQRTENGWRERQIGRATPGSDQTLALGLGGEQIVPQLTNRLHDTRPDDIVEICPSAAGIMSEIRQRIIKSGGAALIIDYGNWRSLGDSFQAVRAHKSVSIFDNPGCSDLTAHVDFEALVACCHGLKPSPICPQGLFLNRLGIRQRADSLAKNKSDDQISALQHAVSRLCDTDQMGTLFKVLGLTRPQDPVLAGLSENQKGDQ